MRMGTFRFLIAVLAMAAGIASAEPPLPQQSGANFLGVDTCGSSQCHGSPEAWRNATVLMRERRIWEAHDPHARAWQTLHSESGQRIANNLGLADAGKAPQCLTCHATFVPEAQRGPAFDLNAGVGCESCHGAGGAFLRTHVQPTSTHAGNVAAGLYPTTDAAARARLCLSCHQGDAAHPVSHRLYGAGHPRLRFELDTYSVLQPYHFNPDADYRRRKPVPTHFALWAAGQIEAARRLSQQIRTAHGTGLFPEFAVYDCHGCHRSIPDDVPVRSGTQPGVPRLVDAPLLMLRAVTAVIAPELVATVEAQSAAVRAAIPDPGALAGALARLDRTLEQLAARAAQHDARVNDGAEALARLAQASTAAAPLSFLQAEAAAMGLSTLLTAEQEAGRLTADAYVDANAALDVVYAALADEAAYQPSRLAAALVGFAAKLPYPMGATP